MTLGEFLMQARNERGYSLRALSDKCSVSAAEISRIESGVRKQPSPAVLRAVAEALVISYPYLLQLAGYMADEEEPKEKIGQVFTDGNGNIIDVATGASDMYATDRRWANVAYRVTRELSDSDREMLTDLVEAYMTQKREKK